MRFLFEVEDLMRHKYGLLTFMFLFIAFISNCQSIEEPVPTTIVSTSTQDEQFYGTTQTGTQTNPTNETESGFWKIIDGHAREMWWEQDSRKLYTMLSSGDYYEFDVVDKETKIATGILPPATPQPDLLQQLPSNAKSLGPSPSREKALYVIAIGPTPTPPSIRNSNFEVPAQLWLWQNGQSKLVGEIIDCVSNYQWSANEEKVIIFSHYQPECVESKEILVDLNTFTLTQLFPEMRWTEVKCCSLSPDGSQLIYYIDYELFILDSQSFATRKINAPTHSYFGSSWIDDNRLLVAYFDDKNEPSTFGILDLGTGKLIYLFSEGNEYLGGKYVFDITISPDGKWMAFLTSEIPGTSNAAWIMKLPDL